MLPCGTPCSCSKVSDNVEPIRTLKDLSDKKFDIKFGNHLVSKFGKEFKSRKKIIFFFFIFFFGGGGGGGGEGLNTRAAISYTQDTLSQPLLQNNKIEGIVTLTIKGR